MQKTIKVRACNECPFFVTTLVSVLSLAFKAAGQARLVGECDCPNDSGLRHFPAGADPTPDVEAARARRSARLKIFDGEKLPEACPLRGCARVVEVG